MPVLVDEALVLSESAAILVHLAEKTGKLLPRGGADRARVLEQLFFHASALSPAFGNAGFFKRLAAEANRVLDRLDILLGGHRFVAGDDFTIADITHFGWLWRREFPDLRLDGRPAQQRSATKQPRARQSVR